MRRPSATAQETSQSIEGPPPTYKNIVDQGYQIRRPTFSSNMARRCRAIPTVALRASRG